MSVDVSLAAGFGMAEITPRPPGGGPLAGYGGRGHATGVLDDLHARALVLESSETATAVIALDVCALHEDSARRIAQGVASQVGIPATQVTVAATHSHASFVLSDDPLPGLAGKPDREATALGEERAVEAARQAWRNRRRATWDYQRFDLASVAANRHHPGDVPHAMLVAFNPQDRAPITLFALSTHPTVLGGSNTSYSADLSGAVAREAERRIGGDALVLTGAAGDVSTRFTRRSQCPSELDRLAGLTVDRALEAWRPERFMDGGTGRPDGITVRSRLVELPARPRPLPGEISGLRTELEERRLMLRPDDPASRRVAQDLVGLEILAEMPLGEPVTARMDMLRIGPLTLVTVPGEPVTELARRMERACPTNDAFVIGYAGGYVGYLLGDDAEHSYESFIRRTGPKTEHALLEAVRSLSDSIGETT